MQKEATCKAQEKHKGHPIKHAEHATTAYKHWYWLPCPGARFGPFLTSVTLHDFWVAYVYAYVYAAMTFDHVH